MRTASAARLTVGKVSRCPAKHLAPLPPSRYTFHRVALVRCVVAAVACLVLLAPAGRLACAAEPAADAPVFTGGIELVKLTVTVRDEKGALVTDLKPEDFVVSEDGHPQTLALFAQASQPVGDEAREKALTLDLGLLMDT